MGLVELSTNMVRSLDHKLGHWQSSLASVRKLSDTLSVEQISFKLSLASGCSCKQRKSNLDSAPSRPRHGSLPKSLAVCPPQIVSPDAQQSAVG